MGMLKLEVPHSISLEDAKKRVEALLSYWSRKYGVKSTWEGDKVVFAGKAMGISIDGSLSVLASKIAGEASDPGMLLRGQAQKYLTRKFSDYLDPKKSLADLSKDD